MLVDESGYESLTMSAVAGRLSISGPGLYKHVSSLDEIRRQLAIVAIGELREQITQATIGRAGPAAIRAAATAYRGYARAHPGRYAASIAAPPADDPAYTAASDAAVATMFAVLSEYQFEREEAIDAVRAFRAVVHGFVSLETAGGFGLPQSLDASFDRLVDTYIAGLDRRDVDAPAVRQ